MGGGKAETLRKRFGSRTRKPHMDTVLKVSLAGLFHDLGKFAQGVLPLPQGYKERNADLYQPFNFYQKHHTHEHALYTAAFIETYAGFLPPELNSPGWGEGEHEDSFINLAAKHHKPETPLQWIITQADRLSSGFDRTEFEKGEEIGIREYRSTRLLPIFERLLRKDKTFEKEADFLWRYPLSPLSATSIFPKKAREISQEQSRGEYQELFQDFCKNLPNLCYRNRIDLWAQHFDSFLRIYTSHIPASRVGRVIHDVSLYDHLRTTAALAGALYVYHRETETLELKAIKDDSKPKFLLVSGDFYGIQDFIFRGGGEERHHRAKLLRGRSFLISLLVELAAEMFCEEADLTFLSIFFSAAGKFHLLAPNLDKTRKALNKTRERINRWLYEYFFGECSLGFAATEARPEDFVGGRFHLLWQEHLKRLEEAKFERFDLLQFGGAFNEHIKPGYLDRFRNDLDRPLCPLCGKRPSDPEVIGDKYISREDEESRACACRLCRDQVLIGTHLVKGERLAVLIEESGDLKEPLFGYYQLRFVRDCAEELAERGYLLKLLDLNVRKDGTIPIGATFLPVNGYVPIFCEEDRNEDRYRVGQREEQKKFSLLDQVEIGRPKTFYHLAQLALTSGPSKDYYGVPALAVFKADVDNLGAIFACGLPPKLFTISRLSTVSRQLHNFFTLYLPYALAQERNGAFRNIYTVFAGGDDLFLIGPWTEILAFAPFLRQRFKAYVCENPELHFSAGITLHKPHVPVDLLAHESEEALKKAKSRKEKDSLCLFGEVARWEEFEKLQGIKKSLEEWYRAGYLSRRTLYRLNELSHLAAEEEVLLQSVSVPVHRLCCLKWPALLRYFLVRQAERFKDRAEDYHQLILKISLWLANYRGRFKMALWPLLYNTRKQSFREGGVYGSGGTDMEK